MCSVNKVVRTVSIVFCLFVFIRHGFIEAGLGLSEWTSIGLRPHCWDSWAFRGTVELVGTWGSGGPK